jgi:histidinol-phosphate aminotransferase
MAGLRLGCIFTHRANASVMRKAASPYPVNIAALVAARAFVRDTAFLRSTLLEFAKSRDELRTGLTRMGLTIFPSAGNFILVDLGERAKRVVIALARQKILIRDRSSDFGGRGYVRITIGTTPQTRRVLRALKEVL